MAMSKPPLLAWATIQVTEDQTLLSGPFCALALAKTNKRRISFTEVCDVSARMLANAIHAYIEKERLVQATLDCVDFCKNPDMSCESLGSILESLIEYQIHAVDLSCNPHLGDSMVPTVRPLLEAKKTHLIDLKVAGCGLTVAGLKQLMRNTSKSRLRLLDISYTRIGDQSDLIDQMLELPMIEELVFRFCALTATDVRTVAEGLPFTGVKSLDLAGNTFSSEGLLHLSSKLPESLVEKLDLTNVGIKAQCHGLSELAKAWVKRPFPKLYLQNNPMGPAEVVGFITLLQSLMPCKMVNVLQSLIPNKAAHERLVHNRCC